MISTSRSRHVESAAPMSTQSPAAGANQIFLFALVTRLSARQSKWAIRWRLSRLEIVLGWVHKSGHAWTARCASRTMRTIAPNRLVRRSRLEDIVYRSLLARYLQCSLSRWYAVSGWIRQPYSGTWILYFSNSRQHFIGIGRPNGNNHLQHFGASSFLTFKFSYVPASLLGVL